MQFFNRFLFLVLVSDFACADSLWDTTYINRMDYAYLEFQLEEDSSVQSYAHDPKHTDSGLIYDLAKGQEAKLILSDERGLYVKVQGQELQLFITESDSNLFVMSLRNCMKDPSSSSSMYVQECYAQANDQFYAYIKGTQTWIKDTLGENSAAYSNIEIMLDNANSVDDVYIKSANDESGSKFIYYPELFKLGQLKHIAITQSMLTMTELGWTPYPWY